MSASPVRPPGTRISPALGRRIVLLAACVLLGGLVGGIGQWLFDTSAGFLAVPLFIAVAWLFVADPTQCAPHDDAASR